MMMMMMVTTNGNGQFLNGIPDEEVLNEIRDMPESTSAFVRNPQGVLGGVVSLIKCAPNQAYCVLAKIDPAIADKYIRVEVNATDSQCLKIVDVQDEPDDMRTLPIFIQVHHNPKGRLPIEHLIDWVSESTLGRINLALKKNVTVDLYEGENLDIWRDRVGFIVTDRQHLREITAHTGDFLKTLHPCKTTRVIKYDNSKIEKLLEFDKAVCNLNRSVFIEYLLKSATALLVENDETLSVEGLLIAKNNQILALYAESVDIAHTLMHHFITSVKYRQVILCTKNDCWDVEQMDRTRVTCIERRHTRAIPAGIKWDCVYAANIGQHLL